MVMAQEVRVKAGHQTLGLIYLLTTDDSAITRCLGINCEATQITHTLGFETDFPIQNSFRFTSFRINSNFDSVAYISTKMSILLL